MVGAKEFTCTICGESKLGENGWFLLVEDPWLDRLKVLHWEEAVAAQSGMHCVCSAAHVRELVAHWMAAGSLAYPFACDPVPVPGTGLRHHPADEAAAGWRNVPSTGLIGELAVHRESLARVLSENPQSLSTILEALLDALRPEAREDQLDAEVREKELTLV